MRGRPFRGLRLSALAVIALYDELWSGVAVVAAPGVERAHRVDHAQYTLWVFALPLLAAAFIEAPIALASDRFPRHRVLAVALGVLAAALGLCALAQTAWLLSVGLALAGVASGVACGTAQAEIVATHPGGAHHAMSRWVALGAIGDALTPLVVAAALALGGTHRGALAAIAMLLATQALVAASPRAKRRPAKPLTAAAKLPGGDVSAAVAVAESTQLAQTLAPSEARLSSSAEALSQPSEARLSSSGQAFSLGLMAASSHTFASAPLATPTAPSAHEDTSDDDAPPLPLLAALRGAARLPGLWLLLFAAAACALLDEVVVALAALRLHDHLGWSDGSVAAAMSGLSCGALVGAVATERLLQRFTPRALLLGSTLSSLAFLGCFIAASSTALAASSLFLLGASAAPHYPLTKAAAYELVPGQPGLINALAQVFVALDVAMPLGIGVVASRYGLGYALALLSLQPVVVLAVALRPALPSMPPKAAGS